MVQNRTLHLRLEVDDGSDLNILASHVAKILLEERIGFSVSLELGHADEGALVRLANGTVDVNMGVAIESAMNQVCARIQSEICASGYN